MYLLQEDKCIHFWRAKNSYSAQTLVSEFHIHSITHCALLTYFLVVEAMLRVLRQRCIKGVPLPKQWFIQLDNTSRQNKV